MRNKIVGTIVTLIIIAAGVIALIMLTNQDEPAESSTEPAETATMQQEPVGENAQTMEQLSSIEEHLKGANIGETVDATDENEVQVSIDDFIFEPTVITVSKGTTVTWTNEGNVRHDVTSTEDSPMKGLSSDLLANGESYSFTFEDTGDYYYYCQPHPFRMRAAVRVVE